MKCKGITKKFGICGTSCKGLYCQYHRGQYWGIFVVASVLLTIYSVAIQPILSPKENVGKVLLDRYEDILQENFNLKARCAQLQSEKRKFKNDCILEIDGVTYETQKLIEIAKIVEKESSDLAALANAQLMLSNHKVAKELFLKAATKGNTSAMGNLGMMYSTGLGTTKDYKKAEQWLTKSAENGRVDAMYNLGVFYAQEVALIQDYKKALRWFLKAANKEYPPAMYNLGMMYSKGLGTTIDEEKAKEWFLKANENSVFISSGI